METNNVILKEIFANHIVVSLHEHEARTYRDSNRESERKLVWLNVANTCSYYAKKLNNAGVFVDEKTFADAFTTFCDYLRNF